MKTTITELAIVSEKNAFKLPRAEWGKYVEVVVKTSDKKTGQSVQMSFLRNVETESKTDPAIAEATKKCVDTTVESMIHFLKSKGDDRFKTPENTSVSDGNKKN